MGVVEYIAGSLSTACDVLTLSFIDAEKWEWNTGWMYDYSGIHKSWNIDPENQYKFKAILK